jgi:hypothetical protein
MAEAISREPLRPKGTGSIVQNNEHTNQVCMMQQDGPAFLKRG